MDEHNKNIEIDDENMEIDDVGDDAKTTENIFKQIIFSFPLDLSNKKLCHVYIQSNLSRSDAKDYIKLNEDGSYLTFTREEFKRMGGHEYWTDEISDENIVSKISELAGSYCKQRKNGTKDTSRWIESYYAFGGLDYCL